LAQAETDQLDYEALELYGFSLEYPNVWDVELRPGSTSTAGDAAFKTRGIRFFLTWGPLEETRSKFGTLDRQADESLKKIRKSGDVRRLEVLDHKDMEVNGHRSIFNSVRLSLGVGLLAMKTVRREVYSLHLYCEPSQRFFVLYANGAGEGSLKSVSDVFFLMSSTLRCHSHVT
jgi:hypothetical protein